MMKLSGSCSQGAYSRGEYFLRLPGWRDYFLPNINACLSFHECIYFFDLS